jgi:ATP-dependent RNA helicase DeaD
VFLRAAEPGSARPQAAPPAREQPRRAPAAEQGMETYRIEVGKQHGVLPKNIVGAIANEAGLDSTQIGRVEIREDHSLVDLPEGMPRNIFQHLRKVWVAGQRLQLSRVAGARDAAGPQKRHPHKGRPRR